MKTKKEHNMKIKEQYLFVINYLKKFKRNKDNTLTGKAQAITCDKELKALIARVNEVHD